MKPSDEPKVASAAKDPMGFRAWEDVFVDRREFGPFSATADQVALYRALVDDPSDPPGDLVPNAFIGWVAVGAVSSCAGFTAMLLLRWEHYEFFAPLRVGEPFWCVVRTDLVDAVDARSGIAQHVLEVVTFVEGRKQLVNRHVSSSLLMRRRAMEEHR